MLGTKSTRPLPRVVKDWKCVTALKTALAALDINHPVQFMRCAIDPHFCPDRKIKRWVHSATFFVAKPTKDVNHFLFGMISTI
jgi:hypothetical protein